MSTRRPKGIERVKAPSAVTNPREYSPTSPTVAAGHFGSQPVFYVGRAEFLRNKQAAGRPQDLADIDALT
jgi:hypothetical protein